VVGDPVALKRLEGIVHPMVQAAEATFLAEAQSAGATVAVLDIPLLYETGGDKRVDAVVVVSAPAEVQRARILKRDGMSLDKLETLLARQLPDADKRRRADFVVDTSGDFPATHAQLRQILRAVTTMPKRRR
jgi:dephospho-CoA kinase